MNAHRPGAIGRCLGPTLSTFPGRSAPDGGATTGNGGNAGGVRSGSSGKFVGSSPTGSSRSGPGLAVGWTPGFRIAGRAELGIHRGVAHKAITICHGKGSVGAPDKPPGGGKRGKGLRKTRAGGWRFNVAGAVLLTAGRSTAYLSLPGLPRRDRRARYGRSGGAGRPSPGGTGRRA